MMKSYKAKGTKVSTRLKGAGLALALASTQIALSGCMSDGGSEVDVLALAAQTERPDVLYNQGLANLEGGRLGEAAAKFEAIDRQHPYSEWARKALVMNAFTSYRSGAYEEAINAAKRYLSLYPGTEEAAYAQYIIGLSYWRQIPDIRAILKGSTFSIALDHKRHHISLASGRILSNFF